LMTLEVNVVNWWSLAPLSACARKLMENLTDNCCDPHAHVRYCLGVSVLWTTFVFSSYAAVDPEMLLHRS
jgi:hypothetical protein